MRKPRPKSSAGFALFYFNIKFEFFFKNKPTCPQTQNPAFNEQFTLAIENPLREAVGFVVCDRDRSGAPKILCSAPVMVNDLAPRVERAVWLQLTKQPTEREIQKQKKKKKPVSSSGPPAGQLHVALTALDFGPFFSSDPQYYAVQQQQQQYYAPPPQQLAAYAPQQQQQYYAPPPAPPQQQQQAGRPSEVPGLCPYKARPPLGWVNEQGHLVPETEEEEEDSSEDDDDDDEEVGGGSGGGGGGARSSSASSGGNSGGGSGSSTVKKLFKSIFGDSSDSD